MVCGLKRAPGRCSDSVFETPCGPPLKVPGQTASGVRDWLRCGMGDVLRPSPAPTPSPQRTERGQRARTVSRPTPPAGLGQGARPALAPRAVFRRGRVPWRARAPATGLTTGRAHAETYGHKACEACGARARCGSGGTGVPAAERGARGKTVAVRRRQVKGGSRLVAQDREGALVCILSERLQSLAAEAGAGADWLPWTCTRLRMRAPCCPARGLATSVGTGPSAKLFGTRDDGYACRPFHAPEARGDR